jgi:hypothetical protein
MRVGDHLTWIVSRFQVPTNGIVEAKTLWPNDLH